jgi:hypothetical protein
MIYSRRKLTRGEEATMSSVRVEPGSPGCCLLSLLLLPFNILFIPLRILIGPRRSSYRTRGRWM